MSTLEKKAIKNAEIVTIKDVHFLYPKFMKAVPIKDQAKWKPADQNCWEYSVQCLVDEDTADEWDVIFTNMQSKKLMKAEVVKMLGLEEGDELPCGLDNKAKKFYQVSAKQKTHYPEKDKQGKKTGKMLQFSKELRPRAFILEEGKYKDHTVKTEIGNGSSGELIVSVYKNDYGVTPMLKGIKVDNLVVFGGGSSNPEDSLSSDDLFGDAELEDLPDDIQTTQGKQSDDFEEAEDDTPPFEVEEDDFE